jgi:hypothetical protein
MAGEIGFFLGAGGIVVLLIGLSIGSASLILYGIIGGIIGGVLFAVQ